MTYGSVIKQAREDRRMTQEQLAESLDISRQAVSKWEADLSKPTREKLDRLTEILDIPPETWKAIAAEIEAANRPTDHSRPWKIATGILGAACLALVIALIVVLRSAPATVDAEDGTAPEPVRVEAPENSPPENTPEPEPISDTLPAVPEVVPLDVEHDYSFGDWPLGEYDPELIPFLEDGEQVMEHEVWVDWFPDGTRLGLVKCEASWDPEVSNMFVVWAPPVGETGGVLDCRILFHIGEGYAADEDGWPMGEKFANVLGYSGLKLTLSASKNLYRHSYYFVQQDEGSVHLMTSAGSDTRQDEVSKEVDVDEDGELEIICHDTYWRILDTKSGEEGAFQYSLNDADWLSRDPYVSGFDPGRKAFVTLDDATNTLLARYVLRDGELVRVPETDFSVEDYPDVAGTEIIFVTDEDVLSDGYGPDVILPYNPAVRITHRQQAYIALQELYNLTGLKVDSCYCAAGDFDIIFSLVPDGFNMRSFYSFWPNGSLGSYGEKENISTVHITWRELQNEWSPLVFADAVKAEGSSIEEKLKAYYDRLWIVKTGDVKEVSGVPDPGMAYGIQMAEIWLENGDLYNIMYQLIDGEPAISSIYGPYPDGIVNH